MIDTLDTSAARVADATGCSLAAARLQVLHCEEKTRRQGGRMFHTKREAKLHAAKMRSYTGAKIRAFHCHVCHYYHVGRKLK